MQKRFVAVDKDAGELCGERRKSAGVENPLTRSGILGDLHADGKLSLAEVTLLMDPGKDEALLKIEIQEIMEVSFRGLQKLVHLGSARACALSLAASCVAQAQDKDKDGRISLEEFLSTEGGGHGSLELEQLA